ncbi:MAG: ABC transporter substrate-binding protein, partial [Clostridia bacterium]
AELRVRLSYSTPRALLALSRLTPLPRHALEDVGAAGMGEALTDSSLPVAGAYHMVERVEEPESTLLHFERVEPTFEEADEEDDIADDARGPDDDMPDLIDYHFVENASTEGLDDLDMFYLPPGNSGVLELPAESWTKTATVGADAVEYLGFNVQNEFLADPGVRRAVAYALDREEAVRLMFGDRAVSSGQPLEALMGDFDGLQHVEYDPDRARELLKEAGYGEGAKRTPELYLLYPRDGSGRERLAETIAADLSEIGITLHPISADERSLLYTVFGRERYDMYLLALPLDTLLSPETWDEGGLLEYPGERPEPPSFEFMLYEPRSREHWRWLLSIIDDFPVAFLGYPRGEVYVRDGAPAFTPWRSPALGNIENWSGFLEEGN